ncbi:hypothetical protein M501DRAFT_1014735 [Patellaria atrata CBS 101060]|uniref:GPI anchored serine-threonine rich protein n=1 Tax=Patellaria atrata CBS 101060 TaxID=1346257 RepID=A0A9P4SDH7_9PEZI|nr:hypothetical protein M501DRAFT_1014735 [Patellaria atrata CBS 101060]
MRFAATVFLASVAGFAAAQTSTAPATSPQTTSECLAQNIVDACLAGQLAQADTCEANDWICLCEKYTNVLICFDNCPGSPDRFGYSQQKVSYCNAAAPLLAASSASRASARRTASSTMETAAATTTESEASETASTTESAAAETSTGAASLSLVVPAGGLFALFLGVVGAL